MSGLATGFVTRMRKQDASAQVETTPDFEVSDDKRSKWSGLNEEVQKSPIVVISDSRASDVLSVLEGSAQDASKEACASLEDEIPAKVPALITLWVRLPLQKQSLDHCSQLDISISQLVAPASQGVIIGWF